MTLETVNSTFHPASHGHPDNVPQKYVQHAQLHGHVDYRNYIAIIQTIKYNNNIVVIKINKFSLQVLHEPRVRMACGIVRLDLSTVATVRNLYFS